jgi:LPXTG-motif cell wall-anchored protein
LADTGSHASELLPVGIGLVLIGGAFLLCTRRRGSHVG